MSTDRRTGWLRELKVGDEVLAEMLRSGHEHGDVWQARFIAAVVSVSPEGDFCIEAGTRGYYIHPHGANVMTAVLRVPTDEDRRLLKRCHMRRRLQSAARHYSEVADEKLARMVTILDEAP